MADGDSGSSAILGVVIGAILVIVVLFFFFGGGFDMFRGGGTADIEIEAPAPDDAGALERLTRPV